MMVHVLEQSAGLEAALFGAIVLMLSTFASAALALVHFVVAVLVPGSAKMLRVLSFMWGSVTVVNAVSSMVLAAGGVDSKVAPFLPLAVFSPLLLGGLAWAGSATSAGGAPGPKLVRWANGCAPLAWLGGHGYFAIAVFPGT